MLYRTLKTGIVGLPNVGKSTLFNALMGSAAAAASNFPFCTIEPNHGTVPLKDHRLDRLADLHTSERSIPTSLEFVDIAGIIKGASKGLGLGNKFLANIRECDALVQVVRCFEDDEITHVDGSTDPRRDIDVINSELALADLSMVENVIARTKRKASPDELAALNSALEALLEGQSIRDLKWTDGQAEALKPYQFLTSKPVIYAANVSEDDLREGNAMTEVVRDYAAPRGDEVIIVSAQTESELAQMSAEDRDDMLEALGVDSTQVGLHALVKAAYKKLGLITFYTSGETETRAWTVPLGATAPNAAGKIHTDFEKGFIRAETTPYAALDEHGSMSRCKEKGLVRSEGKAYVVVDGDVMLFRFR